MKIEARRQSSAAAVAFASAALTLLAGCQRSSAPVEEPVVETPPTPEERPLLGSRHGGHLWFDFCRDKGDDTLLPPDPRSLVVPGVDEGRAVAFNAYWQDCHVDPEFLGEQAHPNTCGQLRASAARGAVVMRGNGGIGAGTSFAKDDPESPLSVTAEGYNGIWRTWGLTERPDNFDELVAERFGSPLSNERNPYPLPGEDPNATDGGSGQLPIMLTQMRMPDGTWTGRISSTCHTCHSSAVGSPEDGPGLGVLIGAGNPLQDLGVMSKDLASTGNPLAGLLGIFARQRGNNNASFFNLLSLTGADPAELPAVVLSGSTATEDTPPWWNMGSRPFKFWDGLYLSDATRVDMALFRGGDNAEEWAKEHAQDADKWILDIKSPAYPLPVNTPLAEAGAILFHVKDLWGAGLDNPRPRPKSGNGSCASCHGAYSPRYVHDTKFLAAPELEGIAGYVVPDAIIGTDPVRRDTMDEDTTASYARTFSTYPETEGTDYDCRLRTLPELRQGREPGYLAPPLYGVWATAPYLHNGSVPDLWGVLAPAERPAIWRRVSTPARADQKDKVVMGFDTSLQRAYDQARGGWRYDEIACGSPGAIPLVDCGLPGAFDVSPVQALTHLIYGNVLLAWNIANAVVFVEFTPQQIENRKIYNTGLFGQGNEGHDFTAVLNDTERRALIEYLKTL